MNRIDRTFKKIKAQGKKALVCFLTCGDPSFEVTKELVEGISKSGADIVELGIPFSDPLADGPCIQAASFRALQAGATVNGVLENIKHIRESCEVPIVLMTYYNPVQKYGVKRFAEDAAKAGADGVILTDLPFEEAGEWKKAADSAGIATIQLIAPTSTKDRIEMGTKIASGFIYCVSRTGVTGARSDAPVEIKELVQAVKQHTELPVVVGFGISKPEHVKMITAFADGAVVGSVLVDAIAKNAGSSDLVEYTCNIVKGLKDGASITE